MAERTAKHNALNAKRRQWKKAKEAANLACIEYKGALRGHMAEVLDRSVERIHSYDYTRWKAAYRHYKQILKGEAK